MEQKYTRGWALIDYLWLNGKRKGQYIDFIKRLNETGNALQSAKKAFGNLDKLNSELNAYLAHKQFPVSRFSAKQLNAPTAMTIRKLRDGEAAILPYRMRSLKWGRRQDRARACRQGRAGCGELSQRSLRATRHGRD